MSGRRGAGVDERLDGSEDGSEPLSEGDHKGQRCFTSCHKKKNSIIPYKFKPRRLSQFPCAIHPDINDPIDHRYESGYRSLHARLLRLGQTRGTWTDSGIQLSVKTLQLA